MNRILVILILLVTVYGVVVTTMYRHTSDRLVERDNLVSVLTDSLHISQDKQGTHYSKQAFTSVPTGVEEQLLSKPQQQLMKVVKATKKPIAVVQTQNQVNYTGKAVAAPVATAGDSILRFIERNDSISYRIHVNTVTRTLVIDTLQVRNTTTVQVAESAAGVVVATVTNSNPAMSTDTVESYTPAARKKPHTFLKVLLAVGVGILTGLAIK